MTRVKKTSIFILFTMFLLSSPMFVDAQSKDLTPPKFLEISDIKATAQDEKGTTVKFEVSAVDDIDKEVKIVCEPSSGSFFYVGTTKVVCTAYDSSGNESTSAFAVIVSPPKVEEKTEPKVEEKTEPKVEEKTEPKVEEKTEPKVEEKTEPKVEEKTEPTKDKIEPQKDIIPPEIYASDVKTTATNKEGTTVKFEVSAKDNVDGSKIKLSCEPSSEHVFPIGTTKVVCTAYDSSGNESTVKFTVTVTLSEKVQKIEDAKTILKEREDLKKIRDVNQIKSELTQKRTELDSKQRIFEEKQTTTSDIQKERENYLSEKMEFVKLQKLLSEKNALSPTEKSELNQKLSELNTERKIHSYENLAKKIEVRLEEKKIDVLTDEKKPQKILEKKIDTKIYEIQRADNPQKYAEKKGLEYKNGKTRLVIEVDDLKPQVLEQIKQLGQVETTSGNKIQLNIDVDAIEELTQLSDVKKSRPPTPILQNQYVTEGLQVVNADIVQDVGLTGNGVTVAVLDLAFDVGNLKISDNVSETKSFRYDFDGNQVPIEGFGHENVHGTGVAEIITDIAPDVALDLYAIATEIEFEEAIDYAVSKNVDLIAMSAGWVNYPTDGQSTMTKKVEYAINQGIPFVISAGNYAETHWEGTYNDFNENKWHEFSGTDESLSVFVTDDRVSTGQPIVLYLMWDKPSNQINDFDLVLYDPMGEIADHSSLSQTTSSDELYEYLFFTPRSSGDYSIGISYNGDGNPNSILEVFSPTDMLEYTTASGSVGVPTDAQGAMVVGAVHHLDLELESFSSQGPTNHGKQVPHVVAPDAVSTITYDGYPFYGTSAAAPHVAGIVALMLENDPTLSPSQISSLINEKADSSIVSGNVDNLFGHGKADAGFLVSELETNSGSSPSIPEWVKNNAAWWSEGAIDDASFSSGIEFMIKEGIMQIPPSQSDAGSSGSQEIPEWIKSNAGWWAQGLIDDDSFIQGIQFLIQEGIITV